MYSKQVMANKLDELPDEELVGVLITCDERGTENKKKALDILKKRWQDSIKEPHRIPFGARNL